ncbi:hypothetical protein F4778DRAFT_246748 [Xylariomycetidae sp. FL2044]|nr:hypothetical protein F4778DRAFT_246748 [Xylariomycetidae sp. FL2044]
MAKLPIHDFNKTVFQSLSQTLWQWKYCNECDVGKNCESSSSCLSGRLPRCKRYFQFYEAIVSDYHEEGLGHYSILQTHGDIFKAITHLKTHPDITRAALYEFLATSSSLGAAASLGDLANATTLIVKITTMVDSSTLYQSADRLEKGTSRIGWADDVPFGKYFQELFKTQSHPIWSSAYHESDLILARKSDLRATKLKKHLKLTFRPTHDIRNHLRLDLRSNELEVFHFASYLKEELRATMGAVDSPQSLNNSSIPRQLLLEVLDSLQSILFPLYDAKSKKLLRRLVADGYYKMDPELERFEFGSIRTPAEENISYVFLADRLEELYQEMQSPRPRSWLDKQLQRRSGARYVMLATLAGVALALLLGIVALAVSVLQTWIAYQAWKRPVLASGS